MAGTPAYIIVSDARIKELVDYHNIPHMMMKDLNEQTNIFDLHEKADFAKLNQGHAERFSHYLDFLHRNGLETIYDESEDGLEVVPFDQVVDNRKYFGPVRAFSNLSAEDQIRRLQAYHKEVKMRVAYNQKLTPSFKAFCKETARMKILHKREKCVEDYYPLILEGSVPKKKSNAE